MPIHWTIDTLASVESTQDAVKDLATQGYPEGTVVLAEEQTSGRGRQGRQWSSPRGNLYLSLLLRPYCPPAQIGQIALVAGVALGKAIRSFMTDEDLMVLKWPNDILIEGKKCAGILAETAISTQGDVEQIVLGIGVNIDAPPEGAATLRSYAKGPIRPESVARAFLKELSALYKLWQEEGFSPIRKQWLALAMKQGAPVTVKPGGGRPEIAGFFHSLDAQGNLVIRDEDFRAHTVTCGDVFGT